MTVTNFGEITERLRRSTVLIHSHGHGSGSGIIWSSDGLVVTNAHVLRGTLTGIGLWDGREFEAAVIARDARRDLALLRFAAANLPSASPADSSAVRPGELAIAIGNPLGFIGALATGMIHAVAPLRGFGPEPWIQADIRLAPGNSGGPLCDVHGRVIGINTMAAGGLAMAIPSNAAAAFISHALDRAWLGVTVRPVNVSNLAARFEGPMPGLLVLEVEPASPAANASLRPGDILLGTATSALGTPSGLSRALHGSGTRLLRLDFLRGDVRGHDLHVRRVTVELGAQRPSPVRAAA